MSAMAVLPASGSRIATSNFVAFACRPSPASSSTDACNQSGEQASAHKRAAAHWLQRSALDDDTNADAKFNLQLLISQDPQSAQKQPQPAGGQSEDKSPKGKRDVKNSSRKAGRLGEGF